MTAKEKLAAAKTGKTTSDGKTKTTTKGGWSITTGVQKKTIAHTPKPKSTAGKSIKYHGGKSNVVDLGHNPTKSAVSKGTTKLRTAAKSTRPKARKNTAASTPKLKIPQVGAPKVPTAPAAPTAPKKDTSIATTAKVLGAVMAGGAVTAGVFKLAGKAGEAVAKGGSSAAKEVAASKATIGKKPTPPKPKLLGTGTMPVEHAKPVGKIVPLKQSKASVADLRIPEAPKGLPAPPKRLGLPKPLLGLPGPEKAAPKVAKVVVPTADKKPVTVKVQGVDVSAADLAEQRPKSVVRTTMTEAGKHVVKITTGKKMEGVQAEADLRVGEERRVEKSRRDQGTRQTKVGAKTESRARPIGKKQSSRRKVGQRRVAGAPEAKAPEVPKVEAPKVGKTVKPLTAATVAKVTGVGAAKPSAPKPPDTKTNEAKTRVWDKLVDQISKEAPKVPKVEAPKVTGVGSAKPRAPKPPKVGEVPDILGGLSKEQRGQKLPTPIRGVNVPTPEAKANVAPPFGDTVAGEHRVAQQPRRVPGSVGEKGRTDTGRRAGDAPKVDVPDPKLKAELDVMRAENVKLRGVSVPKVEAPKTSAPISDTSPADATRAAGDLRGVAVEQAPVSEEAVKSARKKAQDKAFWKKQGAARRAARDASITEKGIMTIPTDAEAGSAEGEEAKVRKIQNDLLDASLAEDRGRKTTAPEAVGAATDKRTAADIVGKEAVEAKVRVMPAGPRDLEGQHTGGRQTGTIADLVNQDSDLRDARNEDIRRASNKARATAAARNVTPEMEANLEKAIDAEYDRSLEVYFDDVEADTKPKNQAGPRKPDARPRIMDSMIDAQAELAEARGSAMPPAPADRTTIDQKIAVVNERMKPGGEAIYKGKESIDMLESLRDQKPAKVKAPHSTLALPPAKDIVTEQEASSKRGRASARGEGAAAGQRAAAAKAATGAAGPAAIPRMGPRIVTTETGEAKALQGKQAGIPPATPAVEHGVVKGAQPKTMAQLWSGRMADWGRSAYQAQIKRLTSPMLDVAGEKAKATGKAAARVKTAGLAVKGLGVAALAFTALGAGEAAAREPDPKKRLGKAGEQFKAELPGTVKDIAKFTAADFGVTKVIPAATSKVATSIMTKAGVEAAKVATRAAFAKTAARFLGRGFLAGYIGYHALPYTGKKLAELAHVAVGAKKAGAAATDERKASEAKYGTVELATKTRHAKEAAKRKKGKK